MLNLHILKFINRFCKLLVCIYDVNSLTCDVIDLPNWGGGGVTP